MKLIVEQTLWHPISMKKENPTYYLLATIYFTYTHHEFDGVCHSYDYNGNTELIFLCFKIKYYYKSTVFIVYDCTEEI